MPTLPAYGYISRDVRIDFRTSIEKGGVGGFLEEIEKEDDEDDNDTLRPTSLTPLRRTDDLLSDETHAV